MTRPVFLERIKAAFKRKVVSTENENKGREKR